MKKSNNQATINRKSGGDSRVSETHFYKFQYSPTVEWTFGGYNEIVLTKYPPKYIWGDGISPLFDINFKDPSLDGEIAVPDNKFPNIPQVIPGKGENKWGYLLNEAIMRMTNIASDMSNYIQQTNDIDTIFKTELEMIMIDINKLINNNESGANTDHNNLKSQLSKVYDYVNTEINNLQIKLELGQEDLNTGQIDSIMIVISKLSNLLEYLHVEGLRYVLDYNKMGHVGEEDTLGIITSPLRDHLIENRHLAQGAISPDLLDFHAIIYDEEMKVFLPTIKVDSKATTTQHALVYGTSLFHKDVVKPTTPSDKYKAFIPYDLVVQMTGDSGVKHLYSDEPVQNEFSNITRIFSGNITLNNDFDMSKSGRAPTSPEIDLVYGNGFRLFTSDEKPVILENSDIFTMRDTHFNKQITDIQLNLNKTRIDNTMIMGSFGITLKGSSTITAVSSKGMNLDVSNLTKRSMVSFNNLIVEGKLSITLQSDPTILYVLTINTSMYGALEIVYQDVIYSSETDTDFIIKLQSKMSPNHKLVLINCRELSISEGE